MNPPRSNGHLQTSITIEVVEGDDMIRTGRQAREPDLTRVPTNTAPSRSYRIRVASFVEITFSDRIQKQDDHLLVDRTRHDHRHHPPRTVERELA